jgi:hypothetical protein
MTQMKQPNFKIVGQRSLPGSTEDRSMNKVTNERHACEFDASWFFAWPLRGHFPTPKDILVSIPVDFQSQDPVGINCTEANHHHYITGFQPKRSSRNPRIT